MIMKKIFTFIAAMLVAFAVNATDQYPDPATTNSLATAISAAGTGDVVYLDDGTYYNQSGVDYTWIAGGKNITVRAISGKSPVVKLYVPFRIKEASSVKFVGVKFDGGSLTGYDRYFEPNDATDNSIEFDDCEFTDISKYIIQVRSGKKLASLVIKDCDFYNNSNRGILNQGTITNLEMKDSKFRTFTANKVLDNYDSGSIVSATIDGCEFANNNDVAIHGSAGTHMGELIINNCYFHNSKRAAVFFEANETVAARCDSLAVTNSTFANFENTNDYWVSIIDVRNGGSQTNLGAVVVDRCTFYNNATINEDHVCVRVHKSTNALVSNCIFVMPESADRLATNLYGGYIKNCLTFNYNHAWGATSYGHFQNGASRVDLVWGDPLFIAPTAATPDFSLQVAGTRSPALNAGLNNTHMGNPEGWPTFNVRGSMNEWSATEYEMVQNEENGVYSKQLNLVAGTYQFKVNYGDWAAAWTYENVDNSQAENPVTMAQGDDTGEGKHNISMTTDGRPLVVYFDLKTNKIWASYLYPKVMVVGDFTEPAWEGILMDDEGALSCHITITVPEGRWEFKIIDNNVWYGANGDVDRTNCTDWTLFKEGDPGYDPNINTGLLADIPGDYVLTYTYATKKLDIVYPTSFTRNAANDNYQTLCVPFNASITNAVVYEISSVTGDAVTIEAIDAAMLTAGHSYIVKPSGSMVITKVGDGQVSNPIFPSGTGLYGVLGKAYKYVYDTESAKAEPWIHNYVLTAADNLFHEVVAGGDVTINSTRAYLHVAVPYSAPSLRIIENATDIKNIEGNEAAVKFIQNGQLFIKKNGIVYDVTGAIVK